VFFHAAACRQKSVCACCVRLVGAPVRATARYPLSPSPAYILQQQPSAGRITPILLGRCGASSGRSRPRHGFAAQHWLGQQQTDSALGDLEDKSVCFFFYVSCPSSRRKSVFFFLCLHLCKRTLAGYGSRDAEREGLCVAEAVGRGHSARRRRRQPWPSARCPRCACGA